MLSRILIIEDDEAISNLEKDYLEIKGYRVDVSMDGHEGLELALSRYYDLFIIDIMVPGMNGFEICREIRKHKDTPILIVSAKKEEIDKIKGLGLGADDYITKPFSPGELVARVGAHLERYNRLVYKTESALERQSEIIEIRGLRLDSSSRSVTVNGRIVKLTGKEFELLWYMANQPGTIFSKEDLFKGVWNTEAIGEKNTVAVHVKKLRNKIEVDPSKPQYIDTVWGVGYRFRV